MRMLGCWYVRVFRPDPKKGLSESRKAKGTEMTGPILSKLY